MGDAELDINFSLFLARDAVISVMFLHNRDIAMEYLAQQPDGAFLVRQSSSSPGSYAMTMKATSSKILNYLIENVQGAVKLQVCI